MNDFAEKIKESLIYIFFFYINMNCRKANAHNGILNDDEYSQAEGNVVDNISVQQQQQQEANSINPHYENIYEYIGEEGAFAAIAPAVSIQNPINLRNPINNDSPKSTENKTTTTKRMQDFYPYYPYNDIYCNVNQRRSAASAAASKQNNVCQERDNLMTYDTPQIMRSGIRIRRNIHFNLREDIARQNQDDTESQQCYNTRRIPCENIYERIHDEPVYQSNNGTGSRIAFNRRLNVIGHGIGRIERHLSSSCGYIDHCNLRGHYAVLGHSHYGTVGHLRLKTASSSVNVVRKATNSNAENDVKISNSTACFGCLQGENVHPVNNNSNLNEIVESDLVTISNGNKNTGAIPKKKLLNQKNVTNLSTEERKDAKMGNLSKSNLQWLFMNKWLPFNYSQTAAECKLIDFKLLFSRDCVGCDVNHARNMRHMYETSQSQDLIRLNNDMPICPCQNLGHRQQEDIRIFPDVVDYINVNNQHVKSDEKLELEAAVNVSENLAADMEGAVGGVELELCEKKLTEEQE